MPDYYGDVNTVKLNSGVKLRDLPFEETPEKTVEEQFNDYLIEALKTATDYVEYSRNKVWEEPVPYLVKHITERIAINIINLAVRDQTNNIVQVGEFTMQLIESKILTPAIKEDLKLLQKGSDKVSKPNIGLGIVGNIDEEEEGLI